MTDVDLLLGVSGHSHADPRLAGLPAVPEGRHAFPAGWALLEHPEHGRILFDCGYGAPAREAMRRGLRRVYRTVIGACCPPQGDASALLASRGIDPASIRRVIISHFHPDHIGGLAAFTAARFVAHADAWRHAQRGALSRLHAQIWLELLPVDFEARLDLVDATDFATPPADLDMFGGSVDLFGDGSVQLVELPGHAKGQIGMAARTADGRVLLIADACWQRDQLVQPLRLPWLPRKLATHDDARYSQTLERVRAFMRANPDAWVIPAHCASTLESWSARFPGKVLRAG